MKCKECEFCYNYGRNQGSYRYVGRKLYSCKNPNKPIDQYAFIGYGDSTYESPVTVKTSPRWCPLKNKK